MLWWKRLLLHNKPNVLAKNAQKPFQWQCSSMNKTVKYCKVKLINTEKLIYTQQS